jgi:hypothetical protein
MRRLLKTLCIASLFFITACSTVSNLPLEIPEDPSKLGRLTESSDSWDDMPFYVKLHVMGIFGYMGSCSGSIISTSEESSTILTAAHCVQGYGLTTILVERNDGRIFASERFMASPEYNPFLNMGDAGIILLKEDIDRKAIPLMVSKTVEPGEPTLLGSFGITVESEETPFRVGDLLVSDVNPEFIVTRYTGLTKDYYPCFGSSGGGLLGTVIENGKVKEYGLIGLVHAGNIPCNQTGNKVTHTRVDAYLLFILSFAPNAKLI